MGRASISSWFSSAKYFFVTATRISSNLVMSVWCTMRSPNTRSASWIHSRHSVTGFV